MVLNGWMHVGKKLDAWESIEMMRNRDRLMNLAAHGQEEKNPLK